MDSFTEHQISFVAEGGVTIQGMLSLPDKAEGRVPVVIVVQTVESTANGQSREPYPTLARTIAQQRVAALTFELRNSGDNAELALRAALTFLADHPTVDSSRIGIVAGDQGADAAVKGWSGNTHVRAMALISGRLSAPAKQHIAASPKLPLRLFVSDEDKIGFADMTDAYFLSQSHETDIDIYHGLGRGPTLLSQFPARYPTAKPLIQAIADWMTAQVLSTGRLTEVSFQTDDDWTIYGNFRVPEHVTGRLPAVILLHTSQSDRYAYWELEVALSKAGLAVLNIDWRSRGQSIGKGRYADLSEEERRSGYRDVLAAVNFLASQSNIDANRIGVLGAAMGTVHAMGAAVRESRIRTAVVLTGYFPSEEEKSYFAQGDRPILLIATRGMKPSLDAMAVIYEMTRDKGSELVIYDGGAVGYQLFDIDGSLIWRLVRWMGDKLNQ